MAHTIFAHFNKGTTTPFPKILDGKGSGEGSIFLDSNIGEGGIIVTSYEIDDIELLITAFKDHLIDNDLSALAIHKLGEKTFCFSETQNYIF